MQAMMDKLKELGVRLHVLYLSVDDLESQDALIRFQFNMITARHWLYEQKYGLFKALMTVFVDGAKRWANRLRREYGESLRGKMRRIAEAAERLIISEEEFAKLKPMPDGQQGLKPYEIYASYASYFTSKFHNLHFWRDRLLEDQDKDIIERLPYILLELDEHCLLLVDRYVDGMMNPDWYLSQDIVRSLNEVSGILDGLLDKIRDCAYKCRVYSLLLDITDLSWRLGDYYVGEECGL